MVPKPGDVLHVGNDASVQFSGDRSLLFRVIKVCDRPTYEGWVWLTGYAIDRAGNAVDRREIYVQRAGLRLINAASASTAARPPSASPGQARQSGTVRNAGTTVPASRSLR
jgi:hypothetical protein